MKITASKLIRWAGLPAMAAGIIFAGIQPIHPPDFLASVTTAEWSIFMPLKTIMCLFFIFGITGIYARQVEKSGWLGLVGFLMLSVFWAVTLAYIFAEAFILPALAASAPNFVESFLGILNGVPGQMNIGALPMIYNLLGLLYMVGGLLFGFGTFRAGILPRWVGALLAIASVLTPFAALLPHELQRLAGMPVGIAIALLGFVLWTEKRTKTTESVPSLENLQLRQTGAD